MLRLVVRVREQKLDGLRDLVLLRLAEGRRLAVVAEVRGARVLEIGGHAHAEASAGAAVAGVLGGLPALVVREGALGALLGRDQGRDELDDDAAEAGPGGRLALGGGLGGLRSLGAAAGKERAEGLDLLAQVGVLCLDGGHAGSERLDGSDGSHGSGRVDGRVGR